MSVMACNIKLLYVLTTDSLNGGQQRHIHMNVDMLMPAHCNAYHTLFIAKWIVRVVVIKKKLCKCGSKMADCFILESKYSSVSVHKMKYLLCTRMRA